MAALLDGLDATLAASDADAALVWYRRGDGGGSLVGARPFGLLPEGMPWPTGAPVTPGDGRVVTAREEINHHLPTQLRLALSAPAVAASTIDLPDDLVLVLAWTGAAPAQESVAASVAPGLAAAASAWHRQRTEQLYAAQMSSVVERLGHAVVSVDEVRETATVNPAAARLLGLEPRTHAAPVVAAAMAEFQSAATNRESVAAAVDAVLREPEASLDGQVWQFATPPHYLSVSSWALRSAEVTGRVWVFDDVTAIVEMRQEALTEREARAESDEQFARAMQSAPIGMCLVAPTGELLSVNGALCAMLGRTEKELLTLSWQAITHPEDVSADSALVAEVLAGERDGYRLSKRYLRPDGSVVWGDLNVACLRDHEGSVRHFISQIVDVTDERAARERLRESEERFRMLAENSSDVAYRLALDGRVAWMSPSVHEVIGWSPEQLVGTRLHDLLHPDDVPGLAAMRAQLDSGDAGRMEVRFRMADGSYRWMAVVARDLVDADGSPTGRAGGWRDIDAEVRARHALAESVEVLRSTADGMLDPQVLIAAVRGPDGTIEDFRYVMANIAAGEVIGLTNEELKGRTLGELVPNVARSGLLAKYVEAVETGVPLSLDDFAYDSDILGHARRFDVRAQRVGDGLSLTWRDVTDRYVSASALEQRARHDALTGLLNRQEVMSRLTDVGSHLRSGTLTVLLFCDVDHFKSVNDTFGHAAGDEVLRTLSARVREIVRDGDLAARLGGDELLVVLRGVRTESDAVRVAEKIRVAAAEPIAWEGGRLEVTLSIGVAVSRPDEDVEDLLVRADEAMYAGKRAGRNAVALISS